MACCLDIGTGATANVLAGLSINVVQVVKMVISLPQALSDMNGEVERLNNVILSINEELAQEQRLPHRIVKAWLDKADKAIESSRSIRRHYEQHKNCICCCPNCLCRYRVSKDITDWKGIVAQLHSEKDSDFPPRGEYGDYTPPAHIPIEIPEAGFVGKAIKSAQSKLEKMLTEDININIRIIGVYGMGGVGKTSLLQTINNSVKVRNSFDPIIWVPVSKDYNILNLQDCIADRLEIKNFPDKSNLEGRKNRLCSYLRHKKFLLLLDDMWEMWESVELQSLGVSLNDSGSKIVLTTRDKQVCTSMGAKDPIKVVQLSEEEGWQLFCRRSFGNESVPEAIEDIAKGVARECKGLPLAINVVAAAMAGKDFQHEWEHALHQMRTVDKTFYDLQNKMDKKLFQHLKLSYDDLPDYLKTCFLYFAAYPEDTEINCQQVIDIWISEGLLKGIGESYLPENGHSFIKFLRDRCLIEVVRNDDVGRISSVKIHDILRDLAILIAEKEKKHGCYFKAGQGLSHFPSEEDSVGCERMSLIKTGLHSLPTTFGCSSLSVLLLRENNTIKDVPENFLNQLRSLRVLDFTQTGITSLPSCIGTLKQLASLQLGQTGVGELPEIICDLKELQFLNVSGCRQLRFLPERISELKSLRALDISDCERLSHLPRGISELVTLERLTMLDSSIRLDFEEEANAEERKYGCLKDLQCLSHLRVLGVPIKSPVKQGVMENWSKMRDLFLHFEGANQDYLPHDMQKMKDLESLSLLYCHVKQLPSWVSKFRKLAYLRLSFCKQLEKLPAELPCLRALMIGSCNKLEKLELGFPELERLSLWCLESLECVGAVAAASGSGGLGEAPKLKSLYVYKCPKLKSLEMGFPKLERLILMDLKSLECVGAVAAASGSGELGEGASPLPPMLKSVYVNDCPKLKRLRGEWDKLKSMKVIEGEREWWDAI